MDELGLSSVELEPEIEGADAIAIVTAHDGIDYADLIGRAQLVVDFRGISRGIDGGNVVRL